MSPEHIVVIDPHDIILILFVSIVEHLQYLQFYRGLVLKSFLVPDNFHCHQLLQFVVETLDSLPETP